MAEGPTTARIRVRVNETEHEWDVDAASTLADLLRDRLDLTGCRETCGIGVCGSCTVVADGRAISACLTPAFVMDGTKVVTVEGLDQEGLHPLQHAFIDEQAFQCSFCTPGFLMSAVALLAEQQERPEGDRGEPDLEGALAGHLCRCGSYREIVAAVRRLLERSGTSPGAGR
jgi:aerobic-type carbon monoxide dehydrogenase small subunit (CoxS/CutS family)